MAPTPSYNLSNNVPLDNYQVVINGQAINNNKATIKVQTDGIANTAQISISLRVSDDISEVNNFVNQFKSDVGI